MPNFYIKFGRKSIKSLAYNQHIIRLYIKIKGKWSYLYRAIAERTYINIFGCVSNEIIIHHAFIKRLIKQFGKPQKVITDQAPSTKVAMAKAVESF